MDANEAAILMQRPLESRDFNQVAQWLRGTESASRVAFLKVHFDHSASSRLALSAINNRDEAFEILRFGLDGIHTAHSQRTRVMVQFGVTKLGGKRTIAEIASRIESQPHVVDMALYWIPSMIARDDPAREPLEELQKRAEELGVIRPVRRTVHPDGRVTFADRYGK
jgi:hypothetical protein